MRWLLALLLTLSLVACGGGNDDGDSNDDVTPTVEEPTPTMPSPTATLAASPTSDGSPAAVASRQPEGTGIQPSGSPETDNPTPTSRPVTVVTTPRPIARTPTPRISVPPATEAADDGVTVVLDETFDDPASTMFYTGETEYGVVAAIESGVYTLAIPESAWQSIVAIDAGEFGDAVILAEAGLQGDGAVGVVGRWLTNDDDTWTFYVCWLATDGRAGCHSSVASEWYQLFAVEAGTIPIQEVNQLVLSIAGDEIYFEVNEIEIGTIADSSAAAGSWGVYGESFTGTSVAWFDRVTVATVAQ